MKATTIAAIATPPGTGAVALIRLSGPEAKRLAAKCFVGREAERWEARRQHFGRLVGADGQAIDEVLLTWFPGPRSFTGEEVVEISCHGGPLVTRRVYEALLEAGAEPAVPGEFSQRAFLNGRLDLTQAEAIMDLIAARTDLALKAAGEQLAGRLGSEIESIRLELVGLLAHLEAWIDFPEEDIEPAALSELQERTDHILQRLDRLLSTATQGRILREGLRTVICGAPNAGKSSLLNALLGYDRAIVSELAGTTRDTIEEFINLDGIPLRLIDTAGIRETGEVIEREGVARTRQQIAGAELVLWVVDAAAPAELAAAVELPEGGRTLRILNKADLPRHPDWRDAEGIIVSCRDESSIENLRHRLRESIVEGTGLATANLTSINARHQHCLKRARLELARAREGLAQGLSPEFASADARAALAAVGEVVGRTDIEEILGEIFSSFCIGK